MDVLLPPHSVLSAVIAGILFFLVAPHLAVVSRAAGLALKLAAAALTLGLVADFFGGLIYRELGRLDLPVDPNELLAVTVHAAFWGCLAWAVLAVMQSARPRGVHS